MAAVPVGKAQRSGENRRVGCVELGHQTEMRAAVDRDIARRQRGEMRDFAVEPKEQWRIVLDRSPLQTAVLIQCGRTIVPCEQARGGAAGKRGDAIGVGAKRVGAVEARAGEEGVSQR